MSKVSDVSDSSVVASQNQGISRRTFLKALVAGTVMGNSAMNFLSHAFGQTIDAAFLESLNVTGILPNPADIGRNGIHLRWLFPIRLGFPESFEIFRCDNSRCTRAQSIKFDTLLRHARVEKGERSIFVIFNRPVQYLSIVFDGTRLFPVRIYNEDQVLESRQTAARGPVSVVGFQLPAITAFSYPLAIDKFIKMNVVEKPSDTDACDLQGWEKLDTIEYKPRYINLRLEKLFEGCFNFYLPKDGQLRDQRLAIYKSYLDREHYQALVTGLGHPQLSTSGELFSQRDRNILFNTFFLSIMDPNIAQILGLYYIDTRIESGKKYDYRIKANYRADKTHCGTVYQLGGDFDPLPTLEGLKAEQAKDSFFEFNKTLTRFEQQGIVQLQWRKPAYPGKTDPVSYFIVRDADRKLEFAGGKRKIDTTYTHNGLQGMLVLPLRDKENTGLYQYNDARVKVEMKVYELSYQLFGADAYGRAGRPAKAQCPIRDFSVPAAPVNLRIAERSTGNSTKQFLQFKYGPFQYLRDPDAAKFMIQRKRINTRMREEIRYRVTNNGPVFTDPDTGKSVFRIIVDGLEIKDLAGRSINSTLEDPSRFRFLSFQPAEDLSNRKLALKHRVKYRIRRFVDGRTFDIETLRDQVSPVQNGKGYLYADSAGPLFWETVGSSIPVAAPEQLSLAEPTGDIRELGAKILMVRPVELKIYGSPDGPNIFKSFTEIIVDRALFRSGILNNGRFRVSTTTTYTIKAQGSVASLRARISDTDLAALGFTRDNLRASLILLEGSISLSANQTVFLLPPPDQLANGEPNTLKGIVKLLFKQGTPAIANEGELLLPAKRSFVPAQAGMGPSVVTENIPVSVELLSDIRSSSSLAPADAWVYMSKRIKQVVTPGIAFYFRNYETEITSLLPSVIPDGKGTISAYFGARTIDKSDQHNESALSLPVQHMVAKTLPPAIPNAPYFCLPAFDGKFYVPLPNKDGRSGLCLRWDKLPDSQHPPSTRFELARALDASIISVLRSKWNSCDLTHLHPSQPLLPEGERAALENIRPLLGPIGQKTGIGINNLRINSNTGVYEGVLSANAPTEEEKKSFTHGRVRINDYYLGVTGFNGNSILLRMLTPTPGPVDFPPALSNVVIERLTDEAIKDLLGDNAKLKQLADALPDAFSMITKVPVRCQPCTPKPGESDKKVVEYVDLVPGIGNGRFFYKVRAVDAADNRSGWSPASVAIHQVDTTPPEAPREFQVIPGDRDATLMWRRVGELEGTRFRIYRSGERDEATPITPSVHADVGSDELGPRRLTAIEGSLTLSRPLQLTIATGLTDSEREASIKAQIIVQELAAPTDAPNLFASDSGRVLFDTVNNANGTLTIKVRGLLGLAAPVGAALRVIVGNQAVDGDYSVWTWSDRGLTAGQGYTYRVATVKIVRTAPQSSGEAFSEFFIHSEMSDAVSITALDRSVPTAPIIKAAELVDAIGNVVTEPLTATHVRLTIVVTEGTAWILTQRRLAPNGAWTSPAHNGKRGWQPWEVGLTQAQFAYQTLETVGICEYRAHARTNDGRTSAPSDPVALGN